MLAVACGPDDPAVTGGGAGGTDTGGTAQTDDGTEPTGGGASLPGGTAGSGVTTDAVDDTAGNDDPDPDTGEPEPPPATGIEIVEVTVDQGVRVPVARNGALVGPGERNAAILQDRPAVLRAFYDTDPGYETRSIYAVMFVEHTDGTSTTYESFITTSEPDCEGRTYLYDCRYGSPTGSFVFRLEGEDMRPGTEYRISLFETAPGHEDDISDRSPIFPAGGGSMQIGIENSYMTMRVVVVPFDHNVGGDCPDAPDLNEEFGTTVNGDPRTIADYFGERLFAQNPLDEVEIIVHDVVNYTGNATNGGSLLNTLQQMRFNEGAPPGYFYYGVIRPCNGGPEFSGIAQLGGPTMGQAAQRVGWGVYHANVSTTAETFVHEIGHEQGRPHIACSGGEGVPDPSYPDHPNGDTENWGIDVMSNPITILPPSSHDYMTYCGSTWVSEWGWHLVSPWIQEISSWELDGPPPPKRPLLVGTVFEDGSSEFYVTEGWWDDSLATEDHTIRFFEEGHELVAESTAQMVKWERTEDYNVIVPLPVEMSVVEGLSWHMPGRDGLIDRESLQVIGDLAATP